MIDRIFLYGNARNRRQLANFKLLFRDNVDFTTREGVVCRMVSRYEKPVASATTRVTARRLRVVAAGVKSGAGGGQVRENHEIVDRPSPRRT